jgi:hypothetical protein
MAAMTDFLENKVVDHLFRGVSYQPVALHIGLFTTNPTDSTAGTEVSGGSYARVSVAPTTANWAATNAAGSTAATSSGTTGTTSNNATITFPAPSANWGAITGFGIFDAASSGNLLFYGALNANKNVNNGDAAPYFAAGQLSIQIDN